MMTSIFELGIYIQVRTETNFVIWWISQFRMLFLPFIFVFISQFISCFTSDIKIICNAVEEEFPWEVLTKHEEKDVD